MTAEPPPGPESGPPVTLPAGRAFLVQFRATGRIEHLDSGRAARFGGWAAPRAFIEQTLGEQSWPDLAGPAERARRPVSTPAATTTRDKEAGHGFRPTASRDQ